MLLNISSGATLKSHRHLDGSMQFRLHNLDGSSKSIRTALVHSLVEEGLLDSNKKFPVASFWLTPAALALVSSRL